MTSKYIEIIEPAGSSTPTPGSGGKVIWGPQFGNNDGVAAWAAASITQNDPVIIIPEFVNVAPNMTALSLVNTSAVQASIAQTDLTLVGGEFVTVAPNMTALQLLNASAVQASWDTPTALKLTSDAKFATSPSITDTFTRANNPLGLGVTETGQSWQLDNAGFPGTPSFTISSNKAVANALGANHFAFVSTNVLQAAVEGVFVTDTTAYTAGLVLHYLDSNNYLTLRLTDDDAGTRFLVIGKTDSGTFSELTSHTASPAWSEGDTLTLKVEVTTTTLVAYLNGTQILSYTLTGAEQTKFNGSDKFGFYFGANPLSSSWDNFKVYPFTNVGVALTGTVTSAPFWQSVGTKALATTLGAASIVANMPSGIQVGDLLLAHVASEGATGVPKVSGTSGWSRLQEVNLGTPSSISSTVLTRIADGTEAATQTFAFDATALRATAEVHRIRGVDGTNFINVSTTGSASVVSPVVPGVTTTAPNCLVFAFVGHVHALTQAHSPPAGTDERSEIEDTNTTLISGSSYTRTFAASGATGTVTITCNELAATNAVYHRVAVAPGTFAL